jgi:hypothetical protein
MGEANEAHCVAGLIGAGAEGEEYREAAIAGLAEFVESGYPEIASGIAMAGETVGSRIGDSMPGIVSAIFGEASPEMIENGNP